jgi:hypothetical protein
MSNDHHQMVYRIRELDPDIIAPSFRKMNEKSQGGSKIAIIGKAGCHGKDTKILMYNGEFKNVQDIKIGDKIMGDDSTPRNVLELYQGEDDNMYKIKPVKGQEYIVNSDHTMSLKNNGKVVDISVKEFLQKDDIFQKNCLWFRTGVDFKENENEDDFYLFGISIRCGYVNFIPQKYLINSKKNRINLLAGILDRNTDPIFREENIVDQILFLSRSLGFFAIKEKTKDCYFKLIVQGEFSKLPLKNTAKYFKDQVDVLTSQFTLENIGKGEYYGFRLDGNHRYLLEDFSVTHNSGKSYCIASLLYEKSHVFPVALVMNGTEDSNHFYESIGFPSIFIHDKLDITKLEDFIKRQKVAKEYLPNPWSALVIDDCMDDTKLFNDPTIQYLFKNGRHSKMLFILGMQYALDVKPTIRVNIDGAFIFREPNMKIRKALWENYAGVIPDFNTFNSFMDQLTEDRTALYIHNTGTSNKLEDCVFFYKAKEIPKGFKFGSTDYWDFHETRYNPEHNATRL